MFKTADWTNPQTGGMLNEIIVKEEAQLRAPKSRIEVRHIWDANAGLAGRGSLWKETKFRARPSDKVSPGIPGPGSISISNDGFSAPLSSHTIGSLASTASFAPSRYNRRTVTVPAPSTTCLNAPNRIMMDSFRTEFRRQQPPPRPPSLFEALNTRSTLRSEPTSTLRSTASSAYCMRPSETPLV